MGDVIPFPKRPTHPLPYWKCWRCRLTEPKTSQCRLPDGWVWDDTSGKPQPLCKLCNRSVD